MNHIRTLERIPAHLRQFVVSQDYSAYDVVDQAVWRFILHQTYNQFKTTAHPIYLEGLNQTGIFVDRIPHIEEMDDCLSHYGWGAVCVDGFIPPRAFQEFQALGILTIATEIRTANHLAYTPAPDIVHESAGHAPIVPDATYRGYLQRFGEIGKLAFSSPEDLAVYEAIRNLSIVKEDPDSRAEEIAAAVKRLDEATASAVFVSEAAYLSRLHWWTVEYGLVGKPDDYKIYGAGILSSVGESTFLHHPNIKKLPLSRDCMYQSYDITTQQPQLFVVERFEDLNRVLDEVTENFAFRTGGRAGLNVFLRANELGTVRLNSGVEITGVLIEILGTEHDYLRFEGPCALALDGKILPDQDTTRHPHGFGTPIGRLADGSALSELDEAGLKAHGLVEGERATLNYASGVEVRGQLKSVTYSESGRPLLLTFVDVEVWLGERQLFAREWGAFDLAVGETIPSVFAGASDSNYYPASAFQDKKVPKPKAGNPEHQHLIQLYKRTIAAWEQGEPEAMMREFAAIHEELAKGFPDHWLLPWNMLECLVKLGLRDQPLVRRLKDFIYEIESRMYKDVPVSMGLNYLGIAD